MRVRLYEPKPPELAQTKKQKKTSVASSTWEQRKEAADLFVRAVQGFADNCEYYQFGSRRSSLLLAYNGQIS